MPCPPNIARAEMCPAGAASSITCEMKSGVLATMAGAAGSKPQALPDRRSEGRLVQRVEVEPGCPACEQVRAQLADDVESEGADRRGVVAVTFQLAPDPAR